MSGDHSIFAFAHIGDLHLEQAGDPNVGELKVILTELDDIYECGLIDFAYLPGDIAEDGDTRQYQILKDRFDECRKLLIRPIAGDHDRQKGRMDDFKNFYKIVMNRSPKHKHKILKNSLSQPLKTDPVRQYYYADTISGVRCLFLDMVSAGYGQEGFGLDFRLGPPQIAWIEAELEASAAARLPCAVFSHTYPHDLRVPEERTALAGLIRGSGVRLVEMGHTHYNELAHDGRTLYAAARSVGQNEDGSVGYAVAAIDGPVTSWRFKPLDRALPFVMITSPADRRLATEPLAAQTDIDVRALVLSREDQTRWRCYARVDDGPAHPMAPDGPRTVHARIPWPAGSRRLSVAVTDGSMNKRKRKHYEDIDVIEPVARDFVPPPAPDCPGSDVFRLPAWPEKGIRGDQLGPNRNGRHW